MIRRVCFDVASSYYHRFGWFDGPNEARACFRDTTFRFWAASVFDESTQQYFDFSDCIQLFFFLANADELITFNGRKCDLVVIENLVGEESAKVLWSKPHHDLTGWSRWNLRDSVRQILPHLDYRFEDVWVARRSELSESDREGRIIDDLAGTYRDVMFTY